MRRSGELRPAPPQLGDWKLDPPSDTVLRRLLRTHRVRRDPRPVAADRHYGTISGPLDAGQLGSYKSGFTLLAILLGLGSVFSLVGGRKRSPLQAPGQVGCWLLP